MKNCTTSNPSEETLVAWQKDEWSNRYGSTPIIDSRPQLHYAVDRWAECWSLIRGTHGNIEKAFGPYRTLKAAKADAEQDATETLGVVKCDRCNEFVHADMPNVRADRNGSLWHQDKDDNRYSHWVSTDDMLRTCTSSVIQCAIGCRCMP